MFISDANFYFHLDTEISLHLIGFKTCQVFCLKLGLKQGCFGILTSNNVVNHVLNCIYHVMQPLLSGSRPRLPRCVTPLTGFQTPLMEFRTPLMHFETPLKEFRTQMIHLYNPINVLRDPIKGVENPIYLLAEPL